MRKTTILFLFIDLIAIGCFVLFYGPYEEFRNVIINTAMVTKTHQYIAYTFYDEDTIQKIMDLNKYIPVSGKIDLDSIVIDTSEMKSYDNEYDEAILKRDKGNDDYNTCGWSDLPCNSINKAY